MAACGEGLDVAHPEDGHVERDKMGCGSARRMVSTVPAVDMPITAKPSMGRAVRRGAGCPPVVGG